MCLLNDPKPTIFLACNNILLLPLHTGWRTSLSISLHAHDMHSCVILLQISAQVCNSHYHCGVIPMHPYCLSLTTYSSHIKHTFNALTFQTSIQFCNMPKPRVHNGITVHSCLDIDVAKTKNTSGLPVLSLHRRSLVHLLIYTC